MLARYVEDRYILLCDEIIAICCNYCQYDKSMSLLL